MGEQDMHIIFSSAIENIVERNSSFDSGVLRVCYTGKNRNGSYIDRETFERCMSSIYNCPIVCRYDRETDSIGAHDVELVSNEEGMRLVNITHPVGVIPSDARYWWETVVDDNGVERENLCVDALLWKRQEAYRKIKEDGITDESMEISIKEGEMVDGVFVIRRFEFMAFCLLGNAEPCYETASLQMFSCDDFRAQYASMMKELKEAFSLVNSSELGVVIHNQNQTEGGVEGVEDNNTVVNEPVGEPAADPVADPEQFALAGQIREEIIAALSVETVETTFGPLERYWYVDHDADAGEVYCYDIEDEWKLFGFPYSMNGDAVVIDFTAKKRKKFAIIDFDEGEQTSVFSAVFAALDAKRLEREVDWENRFSAETSKISGLESELSELRLFKSGIEAEALKAEKENVFSMFSDLANVEEFKILRENAESYSVEDLKEKCFAIRGRNCMQANFSLEQKAPKIPVAQTIHETEPYGGVFAEYGFKLKK